MSSASFQLLILVSYCSFACSCLKRAHTGQNPPWLTDESVFHQVFHPLTWCNSVSAQASLMALQIEKLSWQRVGYISTCHRACQEVHTKKPSKPTAVAGTFLLTNRTGWLPFSSATVARELWWIVCGPARLLLPKGHVVQGGWSWQRGPPASFELSQPRSREGVTLYLGHTQALWELLSMTCAAPHRLIVAVGIYFLVLRCPLPLRAI